MKKKPLLCHTRRDDEYMFIVEMLSMRGPQLIDRAHVMLTPGNRSTAYWTLYKIL